MRLNNRRRESRSQTKSESAIDAKSLLNLNRSRSSRDDEVGPVKYPPKFRVAFYVLAILILLCGVGDRIVMPNDVLPEVDIPVVVVVWTYTGQDAVDMAKRTTHYSELVLSNNVINIRLIGSTTLLNQFALCRSWLGPTSLAGGQRRSTTLGKTEHADNYSDIISTI